MRCSAKRVTKHTVTFSPVNGSASGTYTSSPPAGGASPQGEAKVGIVPRGSPRKQVLPRIQKLSPLCTISLLFGSPGLPVLRGVSGGVSRIEFIVSPLSRRRHNESHFAAQSPERAFFFPLFLSAEKEKEVIGDAVTKSLSPNQKNRPHRTASIIYPFSKVLRGSGGFFSKNPPAFLIHTLSNLPEPLADYVACRGYHDKSV